MADSSQHAFLRRILECGQLEAKLAPPPECALVDSEPDPPLHIERPARAPGLELVSGAPRLPRPRALVDRGARAQCLARFAHHELMAVELFAWALLRWPALPAELRSGWLRVLAEEQVHCRLYLERLAAHDGSLEEFPTSDYFWHHSGAIAAAPDGPQAFLAAIGLTLEQANLDFTLLYRDAFRRAGDEESARVCQRVHDDEIRHVRHAARWLRELAGPETSDLDAYLRAVPFPLAPSRAKGRHFHAEARRRAGLSPELIETVRCARSSQETRNDKRPR